MKVTQKFPLPTFPMIKHKLGTALWLALFAGALMPTAQAIVAQTVVCYKKKCVVYPNGSAICEYTPVDCSQVNIQ
ncbi:MAG TPA: hypothetical protein VFT45_15170 [Longimicrobium sp.]|nr:hypothetical protein [Longimicrobium sp.]